MTQAESTEGQNYFYAIQVCFVVALGGFLFGYDWVVIGGAKPFYEVYFRITESKWMQGCAMSGALVGCLVGSAISLFVADRIGRKPLLLTSGLLFLISAIGTASIETVQLFIWFRFIGGIGIGLASNLSPMLIAEISPSRVRGRLVAMNQLTIVIGILTAQVMNYLIAQDVPLDISQAELRGSWNGQSGWRWMFAVEAIPAALFLLLLTLIPESPRWLFMVGQRERARAILQRLWGPGSANSIVEEIEHQIEINAKRRKLKYHLSSRRMVKALALGSFLAVLQQWCGINVVFNYAEEIFTSARFNVSEILFNIVITGMVNLLFTFVAILTVDNWGRKRLLMSGSVGLAIIHTLLGAGYYFSLPGWFMLLLVMAAIACYAMSIAPIVWVVISEIFPNRIRGAGVGFAVLNLWIACTVLTLTFPWLNANLGTHGTFWLYGGICLIGALLIGRYLPETSGLSLEEIEQRLEVSEDE